MERKKQVKKPAFKKKAAAKKIASPKKTAPKKISAVKKSTAKKKAAPKKITPRKPALKKTVSKTSAPKAAAVKKTQSQTTRSPERTPLAKPLSGAIDPLREYIRHALNPAPETAAEKKPGSLSRIFKRSNIIVAVATILVIVSLAGISLHMAWQSHRQKLDYDTFYKDSSLTMIEGENIMSTNAPYWLADKERCFGDKYLSMYAKNLPPKRYFSFKYKFDLDQSGVYKVFLAGSAPGSRSGGDNISLSPYKVRIDYTRMSDIYEETHKAMLIGKTGNSFYSSYEYAPGMRITKIGELYLARGEHDIEFRIYRKPLEGEKYTFYADAIFIVPSKWKPSRRLYSFPEDIFSY